MDPPTQRRVKLFNDADEVGPPTARSIKPPDPQQIALLEQAEQKVRTGQYNEAAALATQVVTFDPTNPQALSILGEIFRLKNNLQQAIACYSRILAGHPYHPDSHQNRGICHLAMGELKTAAADLNQANQLDPQNPDTLFHLGILERYKQNPKGALELFDKAIDLTPYDPNMRYNRGLLLCDMGKKEKALNDFSEAIHQFPEFPQALYARGYLNREMGKRQDALNDLKAFIKMSGSSENTEQYKLAKSWIADLIPKEIEPLIRGGRDEFVVQVNHKEEGPFSQDAIDGMLIAGQIRKEDLARFADSQRWEPLGNLLEQKNRRAGAESEGDEESSEPASPAPIQAGGSSPQKVSAKTSSIQKRPAGGAPSYYKKKLQEAIPENAPMSIWFFGFLYLVLGGFAFTQYGYMQEVFQEVLVLRNPSSMASLWMGINQYLPIALPIVYAASGIGLLIKSPQGRLLAVAWSYFTILYTIVSIPFIFDIPLIQILFATSVTMAVMLGVSLIFQNFIPAMALLFLTSKDVKSFLERKVAQKSGAFSHLVILLVIGLGVYGFTVNGKFGEAIDQVAMLEELVEDISATEGAPQITTMGDNVEIVRSDLTVTFALEGYYESTFSVLGFIPTPQAVWQTMLMGVPEEGVSSIQDALLNLKFTTALIPSNARVSEKLRTLEQKFSNPPPPPRTSEEFAEMIQNTAQMLVRGEKLKLITATRGGRPIKVTEIPFDIIFIESIEQMP